MTNKEKFEELKSSHQTATVAYLDLLRNTSYSDITDLNSRKKVSVLRSEATIAAMELTHFMTLMLNPNQEYIAPK